MSEPLKKGIEKLINDVLAMASISEHAVRLVMQSYQEGGSVRDKMLEMIRELRDFYDKIESSAMELIIRYQPVASDLRTIRSCLKIAYDLSRFGRYAYDIALLLDIVTDIPRVTEESKVVEDMWRRSIEMIQRSIKAFKDRDIEVIKFIDEEDDYVDRAFYEYLRSTLLTSEPEVYRVKILNMLITRYLERIADHACYIAEEVFYAVEGRRVFFKELRRKSNS